MRAWVCITLGQLTILASYSSITWILVLIASGGSWSTLCHSCGFAYKQKALKPISGHSYHSSEDEMV